MTYNDTRQLGYNNVIYEKDGTNTIGYATNPKTGNEFFSKEDAAQYVADYTGEHELEVWDDASEFLDDLCDEEEHGIV